MTKHTVSLVKVFFQNLKDPYNNIYNIISIKNTKQKANLIIRFYLAKISLILINICTYMLIFRLFSKQFFKNITEVFNNNGVGLIILAILLSFFFGIYLNFLTSIGKREKLLYRIVNGFFYFFIPSIYSSFSFICFYLYNQNMFTILEKCIFFVVSAIFLGQAFLYCFEIDNYKLKINKNINEYFNKIYLVKKRMFYILLGVAGILWPLLAVVDSIAHFENRNIIISAVLYAFLIGFGFICNGKTVFFTLLNIILLVLLKLKTIKLDTYKMLSPVYFVSYFSINVWKFNLTKNLLEFLYTQSEAISLNECINIINSSCDFNTGLKFITLKLSKNINLVDEISKSLYLNSMNKYSFDYLSNNISSNIKDIFPLILSEYTQLNNSINNEALKELYNILSEGFPNSKFLQQIEGYIKLQNIKNINQFKDIKEILFKYDILGVHNNIYNQIELLDILIVNYLLSQGNQIKTITILREIKRILGDINFYEQDGKVNFNIFIIKIISNYIGLVDYEINAVEGNVTIDLKCLVERVSFNRKSRVTIPFYVFNIGSNNVFNLKVNILQQNLQNAACNEEVQLHSLVVGQNKFFALNFVLKNEGYFSFAINVSFQNSEENEINHVFWFKILAQKINKKFISVENSFITGSVIFNREKFIGREGIINQIKNNIHERNFILYGHRRIGKTSLLFRFNSGECGQNIIPVFFDMQQMIFYERYKDFFNTIKKSICKAMLDLGVHADVIEEDDVFFRDINQLLISKKKILLILFDEFDLFDRLLFVNDLQFKSFYRSLLVNFTNIKFIFSGFVYDKNYTFFTEIKLLCNTIKLDNFSIIETKDLFNNYLKQSIEYDEALIYKLYEYTNGHPYLLQCFGNEIVNYINEKMEPYLPYEELDNIVDNFLQNNNSYFVWIWNTLMDAEERVLIEKLVNKIDNFEMLSYEDFNSAVLDRLKKNKRILSDKRNTIDFDIPIFRNWINYYILNKGA